MKISICDCCKTNPAVDVFVLDGDGIHQPQPVQRQDGFRPVKGADLCESCIASLRFHWGENAKRRRST